MRFGADASLLDLARGELVPFAELLDELLAIIHDDAVALDVVDDGCGFDPTRRADGFGLDSMRARATELDGSFELESAPGEGTAVAVSLPLEAS
jgi:glucose-6-phosphate-specific signal transduction histidine kinase